MVVIKRRLGVLFLLIGLTGAPKPTLAEGRGVTLPLTASKLARLTEGDTMLLSMTAFGGRYNLALSRAEPKQPIATKINGKDAAPQETALLFKGIVQRRGHETQARRAAAYIAGGRLNISLVSRRSRPLKMTIALADIGRQRPARLKSVPAGYTLGCAAEASKAAVSGRSPLPVSASAITASAFAPARVLQISTDADYELYQAFGESTNAEIQGILNEAEAVYAAELGIEFNLVTQNVFTNASQPYVSTGSLSLLLSFSSDISNNHHLGDADVYHLFTGKNMEGAVVGRAFIGEVCRHSPYSLSKAGLAIPDYIVMAHEIGHTLNALHDDNSTSIMNAAVSSDCTSFSRTSRRQISSYIAENGFCLGLSPFRATVANLKFEAVPGSRNGEFAAILGSRAQGQTCAVKLFATGRRSDLEYNLNFDGTPAALITSRAVSSGSSAALAARFRRGSSTRVRRIFLAVESECPSGRSARSSIKTITIRGYGASGSIAQFITKLQAQLNVCPGSATPLDPHMYPQGC